MPVDIVFNLLLSFASLTFSGYRVKQIFLEEIQLPLARQLLWAIAFIVSGVTTGVNFMIFIKTLWGLS